jgi:hypothetical protein
MLLPLSVQTYGTYNNENIFIMPNKKVGGKEAVANGERCTNIFYTSHTCISKLSRGTIIDASWNQKK